VQRSYDEIRRRGGEVVAVFPNKREHLLPMQQKKQYPFPVLADEGGAVVEKYGLRNHWAVVHRNIPHPATYVIDRAGVVRLADVRRNFFFRTRVPTILDALGEAQAVVQGKS
jgi:peroxiredoxin